MCYNTGCVLLLLLWEEKEQSFDYRNVWHTFFSFSFFFFKFHKISKVITWYVYDGLCILVFEINVADAV